MALINCPECGKEISDKSKICIHCGFPLGEVDEDIVDEKLLKPHTICPTCQFVNPIGVWECGKCKHKYKMNEYNPIYPNKKAFNGIYRYDFWGNEEEVYCPTCNSDNCSHYKEQKVIPGKTKTQTSLNLNPLKPFTVFNHKEKVVRQEQTITLNKFICNRCGTIFE